MGYSRKLEAHYQSIWGPVRGRELSGEGALYGLPLDFAVLCFERSKRSLAHATVSMSQPADEQRLELHMLTRNEPAAAREVAELLTEVALVHRATQALDLGHTVDFGRPWQAGSICRHGLVSLPYLDGPRLEHVQEPMVRCLWLLPISPSELTYKNEHGLDALEQRFEDRPFDGLDPLRSPVV